MGFYKQFEEFNPLSGAVPDDPFSILPSIAWRSRALLKSRTVEQVTSATEIVDWAIDEYFKSEKQLAIARLLESLNYPRRWKREPRSVVDDYEIAERFFEWDDWTDENGKWIFKEEMESQLGIPTSENTSEVDALKDSNCSYVLLDETGEGGFPEGKLYEYFAVLSLWLLAESLTWLKHNGAASVRFSLAGEYALKAMDAVCNAEHLREVARLEDSHLQKEVEKQDVERKQRVMKAEKLNIARHKKDNEAKEKPTNFQVQKGPGDILPIG